MAVFVGPAAAQVNTEALATKAPDSPFGVVLGFGGNVAQGNVSAFDLRASASGQYLTLFDGPEDEPGWMKTRLLLIASSTQKVVDGDLVLGETLAHARLTEMVKREVGPEVFAQVQNDFALLLKWRVLGGVGLRFNWVQRKNGALWGGTGYMAEYEDRDVPEDGPDAVHVLNHRSTSYLAWRFNDDKSRVSWTNTLYFQPRLDDRTDVQAVNETSLELGLSQRLSLSAKLRLRLDTQAPAGLEPLDLRLMHSLTWKWSRASTTPAVE